MSLIIQNMQRIVQLRRVPLRRNLEIARNCLGVQRYGVGLICLSDARIRQLNYMYRKKDTATDVLSFPFYEDLQPGVLPLPLLHDDYNLGDIYLGVEFVYQQCQESQEDFNDVLVVTAVHGLCHLLGYTHDKQEDWRQMFGKETEVLSSINKATGSSLKPLTTHLFDH
ncbi:endoribonuclease YbeY isoform X2 [Hyperolius riggenbachi]